MKQTMLINEKKLSTINSENRKLLETEMIKFLFEEKEIHINSIVYLKNNSYPIRIFSILMVLFNKL